jgi:hypothetical protein
VRPDGSFAEGFFELPLATIGGVTDLEAEFAPGTLPVLRFATRIGGVLSAYVSQMVTFGFSADQPLFGFDISVSHPVGVGSFVGLADAVQCRLQSPAGSFIANNTGSGLLRIIVADAVFLPFPFNVTCLFQTAPGEVLTADDLAVAVNEVVVEDEQGVPVMGDPDALNVSTEVSLLL